MGYKKTDAGWENFTSKSFIVESITRGPESTISWWRSTCSIWKKPPAKKKVCSRCKKPWNKLDGNVHHAFTNHGCRAICEKCAEEVAEFLKIEIKGVNIKET